MMLEDQTCWMNGKCIIFFYLFITALALNAFTKKLHSKKNKQKPLTL